MTPGPAAAGKDDTHAQEDVDLSPVLRIVGEHDGDLGGLIAILEDIHAEYGYLPESALRTVGDRTGRPLVEIYGVATFYRSFSLKPRGRHIVFVCLGTACHVRGAPRVREELERQLGIPSGETTPDREFTLETVRCLGACALGPIVFMDGRHFCNVTTAKVKQILEKARCGPPQPGQPAAEPLDG